MFFYLEKLFLVYIKQFLIYTCIFTYIRKCIFNKNYEHKNAVIKAFIVCAKWQISKKTTSIKVLY